jgi:hypothetical protein
MELIRHEMAHLQAFEKLAREEGITEEIALRFVETFDAAMTEEAWNRLKGAHDAMRSDHGDDNDMIKQIRLIEEPSEAEDFTQMKGTRAAIVHPSAQVWVARDLYPRWQLLNTSQVRLQVRPRPLAHCSGEGSPELASPHSRDQRFGA